ncbi:hypothetical protein [Simkania sp.]|uniref:hypothetical protein n=1 Tax=Simkania sp. TaxID=34094 RepID=UPI003B52831F
MKALEVAYEKQSSQTGFLHREDFIPLYENLCFALALFRTHVGQQVEEGKVLLKRLFGFFSDGFSLYFHEYPEKGTPSHQIRCALPLHYLLQKYHHVIEPPLKQELSQIYKTLLAQEVTSPLYQILQKAMQGEEIPTYVPQFSHEWGLLLLAYQILEEKPNWILEEALARWHPQLMVYSGEPIQEYQRAGRPELTLYDLFMAEHGQVMSKRIAQAHSIHIQGALVFPFEEKKTVTPPSSFQVLTQNSEWHAKGFHLMRYLWGNEEQLHSLVCQSHMQLQKNGDRLDFTYPVEVPNEKERMELTLFTEYDTDVEIFVDGKKQTVFYFGETIEIKTNKKTMKLIFSLEKGEGNFMGHINRGNRPAQMATNGPKDFTSYDWKIGLRSLDRTPETVIGLRVL